MASQLYQLGIKLLNIYLKLSAVLGNKKAKIGNQGRGYWKEKLALGDDSVKEEMLKQ